MKTALMALLILFACFAAAGCAQEKPPEANRIKVMYSGSEQQFFREYGNYFAAKFPDLDVDLVSTAGISSGPEEGNEYEKRVVTENPDLVVLNSHSYTELAGRGILLDLSPFIQRDHFDIDHIAPAVVDYLSSAAGDGKLYGIGPNFSSNVLLYNKDLFKLYGVPEPEGSMSWEQFYTIMHHFSVTNVSHERVYGYHRPFVTNPFSFVQEIANSSGLTFVNTVTRQITIDTEGWRKAFRLVSDSIMDGSLGGGYRGMGAQGHIGEADMRNADLFGQGKAAMTTANFSSVNKLVANPPPFQWGIAGSPGPQASIGMSSGMDVFPIFAIYAKAEHSETAWRVLQYLNSDEVARFNSGLQTGYLPARRQYAPDLAHHDIDLFYRVADSRRNTALLMADFYALPEAFQKVLGTVILEEFDAVLDGKTTVDKAVQRMQERLQVALDYSVAAEAD